jgi:O-antigen/teichoic acid export membrane protein
VTSETTAEQLADVPTTGARSNAGMTTKVVKGSMWTLIGQVLPMLVALVATPFTIRFLGSEGYGVLILVGLIATYFSFADFGMGIASTKFASAAFAEGKLETEGEIVRTAAFIALLGSLIFAVPIFLFSWSLIVSFKVPEMFQSAANIALKITSVSFVLGILSSVLNTPMLSRLRMDLNTITVTGPKVLMAILTPIVLYFGGGVIGAIGVAFGAAILTVSATVFFSGRMLPELFKLSIGRAYIGPLVRFGGAWSVAVVAGILIFNLEKFVLTSLVSVRALAYYSIAFTFANVATLFSQAMLQSLLPAFSQMMSDERGDELNALFSRGSRLAIVALLPMVVLLFIVGRPFLTLWAGPEFGVESTIPFYVLLGGFTLSIFSVLPFSILLAAGRTDYFAKMYWIELPFYALLTWFLVGRFGIVGAAVAFATRTVFDAVWAIVFCHRVKRLRYGLTAQILPLLLGAASLLPLAFLAVFNTYSLWLIPSAPISLLIYGFIVWRTLLDADEKRWLISRAWPVHRLR